MNKTLPLLFLLVTFLAPRGHAAEPGSATPADKRGFNLAHPTPRVLLREMSTDRPDKTECPFTVDAGHLQVELDWAVFTRDHDTANGADTRTTAWAFAPINLKLGLNNRSDLQFIIETANQVRTEDRTSGPAAVDRIAGFGDITVRHKVNFWGNDGGDSALGLISFVKLPTNRHGLGNRAVEGGVILPYNRGLPGGWELGVQTEVDLEKNESRPGHHAGFVNSLTVGHDLIGKLGGYVEIFSQHSAERGARWVGTLDFGLTCAVTRDVQLDAGFNLGLSRAAPDREIFTGISRRF